MAGNSTDAGRSVASKVVAILLTFRSGEAYSLSELARLAGLPVSTAHRLTAELLEWGMLQRCGDGRLRIGHQLHAIADRAATVAPSLHERARRVMEDLSLAADRAVVRLGVLHGAAVAYLEKGRGDRPAPIAFGRATAPAHATAMGRALLAFAPRSLLDAVIENGLTRYTAHTVTSPERLRHALAVIRLTRVAICRREYDPAASAAAVPVFGLGGRVVAALEVGLRDGHDLRLVRPPLIVAGRALSRELQTGPTVRPALAPERQFDALLRRKAG